MGMDYDAHLGYGIKLPKSLADKINESDGADEDEDFEFVFAGDSYSDESEAIFLCIKGSVISASAYDEIKAPINPKRLEIKPYWDQKILDWCKKYKVKNPKIGWWLCSSVC